MNTTQTNDDWNIDFNFEIPPEYRQRFVLQDQDCLLTLTVTGRRVSFKSQGGCGSSRLGTHLNWIEECMNSVRKEFGQ